MLLSSVGWSAFAVTAILALGVLEAQPTEREPTVTPAPIPTGKAELLKGEVPEVILESILKEAAARPR
jgi:hypothetical protein